MSSAESNCCDDLDLMRDAQIVLLSSCHNEAVLEYSLELQELKEENKVLNKKEKNYITFWWVLGFAIVIAGAFAAAFAAQSQNKADAAQKLAYQQNYNTMNGNSYY